LANEPQLHHPFCWITERGQRYALGILAVLTISVSFSLSSNSAVLATEAAPRGIISYEFAYTATAAEQMLLSWSPMARQRAMLSLGLDYLFLVLYPAFISLACARVALRLRERSPGAARLGVLLAWLVLAAGVLDAVENYALIQMLLTGPSDLWAQLAWWCATPKFALVGLGLVFALAGYVASRLITSPSAVDHP